MKRLFLISVLLLFLGIAYADGPHYRFKSRRALQSLWRKEIRENPASYNRYDNARTLNQREQYGEGANEMGNRSNYGIVIADPFSENNRGYNGSDSKSKSSSPGGMPHIVIDPGGTNEGPHIVIGRKDDPDDPSGGGNPFTHGKVDPNTGQGKGATPKPPVGEGLHILLILSAVLIAVKKRLSR